MIDESTVLRYTAGTLTLTWAHGILCKCAIGIERPCLSVLFFIRLVISGNASIESIGEGASYCCRTCLHLMPTQRYANPHRASQRRTKHADLPISHHIETR